MDRNATSRATISHCCDKSLIFPAAFNSPALYESVISKSEEIAIMKNNAIFT